MDAAGLLTQEILLGLGQQNERFGEISSFSTARVNRLSICSRPVEFILRRCRRCPKTHAPPQHLCYNILVQSKEPPCDCPRQHPRKSRNCLTNHFLIPHPSLHWGHQLGGEPIEPRQNGKIQHRLAHFHD